MSNSYTERLAIEHVMRLERDVGREPEDVSRQGAPYDIYSPPRKIEVKAFGGSARGAPVPLEQRQVDEAHSDPENFYVYVVDNVTAGDGTCIGVRRLHGDLLHGMIARTKPHTAYWPTLHVADYDQLTDQDH